MVRKRQALPAGGRDRTSDAPRKSVGDQVIPGPLASGACSILIRSAGWRRHLARLIPGRNLGQAAKIVGVPVRPKAKRQDKLSMREASKKTRGPDEQSPPVGTDLSAKLPPVVDERSGQNRKRIIMGRYVFRDELKPGERWKRRLIAARKH